MNLPETVQAHPLTCAGICSSVLVAKHYFSSVDSTSLIANWIAIVAGALSIIWTAIQVVGWIRNWLANRHK